MAFVISVPIYYGKLSDAAQTEQGLREYYQSNMETSKCLGAIESYLDENFDTYSLHKDEAALAELKERFGMDRISYVLATIVQKEDDDLRYSPRVKEWAKSVKTSSSTRVRDEIYSMRHPCIINGFIELVNGWVN